MASDSVYKFSSDGMMSAIYCFKIFPHFSNNSIFEVILRAMPYSLTTAPLMPKVALSTGYPQTLSEKCAE